MTQSDPNLDVSKIKKFDKDQIAAVLSLNFGNSQSLFSISKRDEVRAIYESFRSILNSVFWSGVFYCQVATIFSLDST